MTTTTRQFGRCLEKSCATRVVLDPATDARVSVVQRNGKTVAVTVDVSPRTELGSGALVGGGGVVYCATKHPVAGGGGVAYERIKWQGVKATTNAMECGSHCWNATSADCKCSCGGAHHGETA